MSEVWAWLLDRLFGPPCLVCGTRVYPADRAVHEYADHGDL